MTNQAHRGMALAQRIQNAKDRVDGAIETLSQNDEVIGEIVTSTLVDHENRFGALEQTLLATRNDFVALADMVSMAIENPSGLGVGGGEDPLDYLPTPEPSLDSQHPLMGHNGGPRFEVVDGDLKEGGVCND